MIPTWGLTGCDLEILLCAPTQWLYVRCWFNWYWTSRNGLCFIGKLFLEALWILIVDLQFSYMRVSVHHSGTGFNLYNVHSSVFFTLLPIPHFVFFIQIIIGWEKGEWEERQMLEKFLVTDIYKHKTLHLTCNQSWNDKH